MSAGAAQALQSWPVRGTPGAGGRVAHSWFPELELGRRLQGVAAVESLPCHLLLSGAPGSVLPSVSVVVFLLQTSASSFRREACKRTVHLLGLPLWSLMACWCVVYRACPVTLLFLSRATVALAEGAGA